MSKKSCQYCTHYIRIDKTSWTCSILVYDNEIKLTLSGFRTRPDPGVLQSDPDPGFKIWLDTDPVFKIKSNSI